MAREVVQGKQLAKLLPDYNVSLADPWETSLATVVTGPAQASAKGSRVLTIPCLALHCNCSLIRLFGMPALAELLL